MRPPFRDRRDGGRRLAAALAAHADPHAIVLALPRGGVPVAAEVARALGLPLDVLVVRKLGVPGEPELAFGALASGGVRIDNPEILATGSAEPEELAAVVERETAELARRELRFRGGRPPAALAGRTVILVDDGIATGATMRAAVAAARACGASRVTAAAPVASAEAVRLLSNEADAVVALYVPVPFGGVGRWYENFTQTGDDEAAALLDGS